MTADRRRRILRTLVQAAIAAIGVIIADKTITDLGQAAPIITALGTVAVSALHNLANGLTDPTESQ